MQYLCSDITLSIRQLRQALFSNTERLPTAWYLQNTCALRELQNLVDIAKGKPHYRIGCTVVYSYTFSILQCCAREHHIGYIACQFVWSSRRKQILTVR